MFVEKSRCPPLKRGAIENLPLAKGDLEGFFLLNITLMRPRVDGRPFTVVIRLAISA
jgi:hypothetical protein